MKTILNIVWFCTFGWVCAIALELMGLVCMITIVGAPLGALCWALVPKACFPFKDDKPAIVNVYNVQYAPDDDTWWIKDLLLLLLWNRHHCDICPGIP